MMSYQTPSPSGCKSYGNTVYGILVSLIAFILTLIALYYLVRRINICFLSSPGPSPQSPVPFTHPVQKIDQMDSKIQEQVDKNLQLLGVGVAN